LPKFKLSPEHFILLLLQSGLGLLQGCLEPI
jgi:hypothetical protein